MSIGIGGLSKDEQIELRHWLRMRDLARSVDRQPLPRWPWLVIVAFVIGYFVGGA